jgi:hypothetical protein
MKQSEDGAPQLPGQEQRVSIEGTGGLRNRASRCRAGTHDGAPSRNHPMPAQHGILSGCASCAYLFASLRGYTRFSMVTRDGEAIYLVHAFQKRSAQTRRVDLQLARTRLNLLIRARRTDER